MTPPVIADLQERYKALRAGGIGSSKSAAIEEMVDELANAVHRGFPKRQVWAASKKLAARAAITNSRENWTDLESRGASSG